MPSLRHIPSSLGRIPWRDPLAVVRGIRFGPNGGRTALLLSGGGLFLLGLLAFLMSQSQTILAANTRIDGVSLGMAPRDDGALFLGALALGSGLALVLVALSPRSTGERLRPALLFAGTTTTLLASHFTVFVNAFILPDQNAARITASFLFHDTVNAQPIATFLLAFITLVLVLGALLAALALLAPSFWRRHLHHPQHVDGHRARLVLLALLILGTGATFVRQFVAYALTGTDRPTDGLVQPNLAIVYYLLAFATSVALVVLVLRTIILVWRPRGARSHNYRESHRALVWSENGLWAIILALTTIVLLAGPAMRPDAATDRVFAVDSKGVSVFFLVLAVLYAVHRRLGAGLLRVLARRPAATTPGWDRLAILAIVAATVWTGLSLVMGPLEAPPASKLAMRMAVLALVLPPFALRWTGPARGRPRLRGPASGPVLVGALALSTVAGILLWGVGNSATFQYTQGGGFLWAEGGPLQSVAAVVRVVAAFFLAVPVMLGLWVYAGRTGSVAAAPLAVVAFAVLIGTNLALAIGAAAPYDSFTGQTEVVVGLSHVALSATEQAVLLPLRLATAAIGLAAAVLLLRQGVRAEPLGVRPGTTAATRATAVRSRAVPG